MSAREKLPELAMFLSNVIASQFGRASVGAAAMSARATPIADLTGPALAVVAARKLREQNTRKERREACAIVAKELFAIASLCVAASGEAVARLAAIAAAFEGGK